MSTSSQSQSNRRIKRYKSIFLRLFAEFNPHSLHTTQNEQSPLPSSHRGSLRERNWSTQQDFPQHGPTYSHCLAAPDLESPTPSSRAYVPFTTTFETIRARKKPSRVTYFSRRRWQLLDWKQHGYWRNCFYSGRQHGGQAWWLLTWLSWFLNFNITGIANSKRFYRKELNVLCLRFAVTRFRC